MARTDPSEKFGFIWSLPIILIFAVGGLLQYVGLLSQTQSNWLALILFGHVFFRMSGWRQVRREILLVVFILYIVFDYFRHSAPAANTFTYVYYIICTIIAAASGRVYAERIASTIGIERFFRFAKWFLVAELIVVSFQRLFTEQFISLSKAPIGYVDAIFGTLFLQSDAALAASCEFLTISSLLLYCNARDRMFISGISLLIVFLLNSDTSKASILFVVILSAIYSLHASLRVGRVAFNALLVLAVISFFLIALNSFSGVFTDFFTQARGDYYHRDSWMYASRFSPLGQMFADGVDFLGGGALTYYNPITKEWLYNAGFSTFYSLYIDFGIPGLALYYAYQIVLVLRLTRNYLESAIFLCVLLLFSFFNFALTDLAFTFSFNLALYLNYLLGRSIPRTYGKEAPLPLSAGSEGVVAPRATK
jgi:hypothetical protein